LLELKISKVDFEVVLMILDWLDEHMNSHFETEENLMRSAGVYDIEKHIHRHDFLGLNFENSEKEMK